MAKRMKLTIVLISVFVLICSSLAIAQSTRTTKAGCWASVSEELLDKAMDYAVAKDYVALQKLLDSKLVFELKAGLEVYVVDTKFFSGKVKIRPVGETVEVWTVLEAVSK